MAQESKILHEETMARMRDPHPKRLLDLTIPFAAEVEKMGTHRAPVRTFSPACPAAQTYDILWREVLARS